MRFMVAASRSWLLASLLLGCGSAAAADGPALYATYCQACHQQGGAGLPGMAPPLKSALWSRLGSKAPEYLAKVMLGGMSGIDLDGMFYPGPMPAWASLSDADVAAISSYVLKDLNSVAATAAAEQLQEWRKTPAAKLDLQALRSAK
jgi:mono/diheme cytochrome c family protein